MVFTKHGRHSKEFCSKHFRKTLRYIVSYTDWYCVKYLTLLPIWTSLIRTDKEQEKICKDLKKKFYVSVHQYGRGADLVLYREFDGAFDHITIAQYRRVQKHLNAMFPYGKKGYKTCVLHGSKTKGYGYHLHLQVSAREI